MKKLTIITIILAVTLPIAIWAQCASCPQNEGKDVKAGKAELKTLVGYNKVNWIDATHYFTYNFDKKPKLGTSVLKVKVYDKTKKINNSYEVFAVADMPSMKGMHNSGDIKFKANKKGELLVPLNFVMPGVWQVDLKFVKDGKQTFGGSFELKI
jgi:hypothetical protein